MSPYLLLAVAIVAEVIGTSLLKSTEGFTRLWPTLGTIAAYGVAFYALAVAIQKGMNVGLGYAMWAGLGTTLIVIISVLVLGEPITAVKILGVGLIIGGVVLLNLGGAH
ncbi:QacE family quaternary ammonium compound efflux SMR transporter [Epidermidibacterium keratini]|uniref:QacE family quaternary ammonium compound efflux SMR transporter n=1 Tax=Epidermidibacterium keratini TaxID=1891644 RepID=A0A7L4YK67_9ACTN|nr:multidrug efflux SMR transporter [Epidermidibacterium keratini]QHB99660.1 QacE family quaternary ammonium compound efflux SMR transporter [Epidermidibacterium keratini]